MSDQESAESPPRTKWTFDGNLTDPSQRQARALEYIAMFLDKIEGHLDRIADAAEGREPKDAEWARTRALDLATSH
jgi:hypothetical protein